MKKILMILMSLIVAIGAVAAGNPDKAAQKYAKKQAKQFEKEGWRVDGIFTLEEVFYNYRKALAEEGNYPLTGVVGGTTSTKTINQAKQWASTNAAITYAKEAGSTMKGRLAASVHAQAGAESASDDSFFEAYESLVQKEIKGELKMNFGLYRETKNGVEYRAYYVVNEDKASKARMRAMENLKKENDFARKHAEDLTKFVREGFHEAMPTEE